VSTSRPACAAAGALLVAVCLAACGSHATSKATTNAAAGGGQPGAAGRGFLQDPKVVACLKKQGVTIPSRPRRGDGGPPPSGQSRPNRRPDSAQMQKLRAALQKCGVDFRGGPPNGQPPPQGEGTPTTSAS
jgi:hypothetical protein